MTAWEFLDKHLFGVGLIVVLIWPSFKFSWRRDCKRCEAAKVKPEPEEE